MVKANGETESSRRQTEIAGVIQRVVRERASGEVRTDDAIIAEHPDLMPELREQLRSLQMIEWAEQRARLDAPGPIHDVGDAPSDEAVAHDLEHVPEQIGGFHIKRVLGAGGMGTVFEATQEKPKRVVALKVMRHGITSRSALRRFEYESQVLARLQHPGIAQVYGAGMHDDGGNTVPYFTMEYIPNALSLTQFARERSLDTHERMKLFTQICDAVHHGHQKGILHRDLKPSNILVDSEGRPKIIDFGVARSTDSDVAITSVQTVLGQLIGTVQYMSPEQCQADPHDIDTRSDVYALGVVFYELLTESLPYRVVGKPVHDATRIVREVQPKKPSTIRRVLKGDIETIAMKALEKDRDRRYQSAREFSSDIRRYFRHEPIAARPPSFAYQLSTFVRRHRVACAAAAVVFVSLTTATVMSTTSYWKAERERHRANTRAETAHQITETLVELFNVSDPNEAQGNTVTAREILDRGVSSIREHLGNQPEIQGALLAVLGRVYSQLGLYRVGRPLLEQAIELQRSIPAGPDNELAASLYHLGGVLVAFGEFDEAQKLLEESLVARRDVYGDQSMEVAKAINVLGGLYHLKSEFDRAAELHQQAIDVYRYLGDRGQKDLASALTDLAAVYQDLGRLDEAYELYKQTLDTHRQLLGPDHLDVALDLHYLGTFAQSQNNIADGERYLREAIGTYRRVLEGDHEFLASAYNNLGALLHDKRDYPAAIESYEKALAMRKRLFGNEHHELAGDMTGLAAVFRDQGELDRAESILREALAMRRKLLGNEHIKVGVTLTSLGVCLTRLNRFEEAEEMLIEAHAILDPAVRSTSPRLIWVRNELATLYRNWGKPDKAAQYEALAKDSSDG